MADTLGLKGRVALVTGAGGGIGSAVVSLLGELGALVVATACGSTLTVDCVLSKAGSEKAWTGGGLFPPSDTDPNNRKVNACVTIIRLTKTGWVYDEKVTAPDNGVYNCNPKNVD